MTSPRFGVVLGTMNFGRLTPIDDSLQILTMAHESGIDAINTADTDYSGTSEEIVGKFLARLSERERPFILLELSGADMGVPHDPDLTPTYLRAACERSLRRLGIPAVDRVVLPRPSFRIPLEETLSGVDELILKPGLAKSVGLSTFPAWLTCHARHLAMSQGVAEVRSELAPLNVLDRRAENEILPNCAHWGMEFFAWGALAQGLLAGRYLNETHSADSRASLLGGIYAERVSAPARSMAARFVDLALESGLEPGAAAIAWCKSRPGVTGAVVGPRRPTHVGTLVAAKELRLPTSFVEFVDSELVPPGSAVTNFFNSAPWMKERLITQEM